MRQPRRAVDAHTAGALLARAAAVAWLLGVHARLGEAGRLRGRLRGSLRGRLRGRLRVGASAAFGSHKVTARAAGRAAGLREGASLEVEPAAVLLDELGVGNRLDELHLLGQRVACFGGA